MLTALSSVPAGSFGKIGSWGKAGSGGGGEREGIVSIKYMKVGISLIMRIVGW